MQLSLSEGIITSANNGTVDATRNCAKVRAENEHIDAPVIQLAKVNSGNELLTEAAFRIHVIYTAEGKVINDPNNIIEGTTKDGYLNLSKEDFYNMNPKQEDKYRLKIEGYSGDIILEIVEIGVSASGYSITPQSLNMKLRFENGELTEYTSNTTAKVLMHYLYDDAVTNIIGWLKEGKQPYAYIKDAVENWAKSQVGTNDMTYDDVLAWLVEYIEAGNMENNNKDEWKTSTLTTTIADKTVVQIVIEDTPRKIYFTKYSR